MQYPEGHVSKSIYAIFRLVSTPDSCKKLDDFMPNLGLAIWTTTPWTVPANAGKLFSFFFSVDLCCFSFLRISIALSANYDISATAFAYTKVILHNN